MNVSLPISPRSRVAIAPSNHRAATETSLFMGATEAADSALHADKQTVLNNQLFEAAKKLSIREIQEALNLGADLNAINAQGQTALLSALYNNFAIGNDSEDIIVIAKMLLPEMLKSDKGREALNSVDSKGEHALKWMLAGANILANDDLESLTLDLLQAMQQSPQGRGIIIAIEDTGETSLSYALCYGHYDIAKIILDVMLKSFSEGIEAINSIEIDYHEKYSALGFAISMDCMDLVKMIIPVASIEVLTLEGESTPSPLHVVRSKKEEASTEEREFIYFEIEKLIEERIIIEFASTKIPRNYFHHSKLSVTQAQLAIRYYAKIHNLGKPSSTEQFLTFIEKFLKENEPRMSQIEKADEKVEDD